MELKQFIKLATVARNHIVRFLPDYPPDLMGACGVASLHLMNLANNVNIHPTFVAGFYNKKPPDTNIAALSGHCWIEHNGLIIDLTATQFADQLDPVHIVPDNDSHYCLADFKTNDFHDALDNVKEWANYPDVLRSMRLV